MTPQERDLLNKFEMYFPKRGKSKDTRGNEVQTTMEAIKMEINARTLEQNLSLAVPFDEHTSKAAPWRWIGSLKYIVDLGASSPGKEGREAEHNPKWMRNLDFP